MKIELEIPDITTAALAMNNAGVAYREIVRAIMLGCEVPSRFEGLRNLDDNILMERYKCIFDMYKQVEAIEREMKSEKQN